MNFARGGRKSVDVFSFLFVSAAEKQNSGIVAAALGREWCERVRERGRETEKERKRKKVSTTSPCHPGRRVVTNGSNGGSAFQADRPATLLEPVTPSSERAGEHHQPASSEKLPVCVCVRPENPCWRFTESCLVLSCFFWHSLDCGKDAAAPCLEKAKGSANF